MVELVQVKVFFCFPTSKVPTFVGSPDCRESRLTQEVPAYAGSSDADLTAPSPFLTVPVLSFTAVISSSSPPVAPPPPSLLLAPPHRAQPPPPVFLVGGLAGCPDSLPPCPCSSAQAFIFPLDRGALAIGVEENPLVVEIVPVDLFVDDCV